MRLRLIAIGKLKDKAIEASCDEYVKRSRSFLPVERIAVRDLGAAWSQAARGGPVVLLDERGTELTSIEFADWLGEFRGKGAREVAFMIGDAHGFGDSDRKRADRCLALSRLTLPHRLAQLLLCEQLYRAGTILAGHPYHHA